MSVDVPKKTRRSLVDGASAEFREFWQERHTCTITTVRPDGTPHTVPVNATLDVEQGVARVLSSSTSQKVRHIKTSEPAAVAVCQADGRRWSTVEGRAVVREEPEVVRDAEARYAERYRTPRTNPRRVVIEIAVSRVLGSV